MRVLKNNKIFMNLFKSLAVDVFIKVKSFEENNHAVFRFINGICEQHKTSLSGHL